MDWSRAKTVIIALLLAVNAFLLVTYIMRENEARGDELTLRHEVSEILSLQGIEVEENIIPLDSVKILFATVKARNDAEKLALRLFGEVKETSDGEGTVYSGAGGNIMFLKEAFSLVYESGKSVQTPDDARALAEEIARKLSVSTSRNLIEVSGGEGSYAVKIPQVFSGVRTFASDIELNISSSGSIIGSGKFIGRGRLIRAEGEVLPTSSLMIKFADVVKKQNIQSIKILEIDPGYIARTPVSGVVMLTPTLCLRTDAGVFYMNMTDGAPIMP
ncbi:MAG: hypothetical protein IKU65_01485 [Oscillospiraceae bacterium]|nr:hypothetical protein [Oscillospiraceae bacterium]